MLNIETINTAILTTEIKLRTLGAANVAVLDDSLESLSVREICAYQELKSIAQCEGKISLDSAIWIYKTICAYSTAKLSHRVVLTQLIAALAGANKYIKDKP